MKVGLLAFVAVATWITELTRYVGSAWVGLLPHVSVVAVLIAARRAQPGRHRRTGCVAGLVEGIFWEDGLLVPCVLLVSIGAMAAGTRLFFPVDTGGRRFVLGWVFSGLYVVLGLCFPGAAPPTTLSHGGFAWAVAGFCLTGGLFAWCDGVLERAPGLRHAVERP